MKCPACNDVTLVMADRQGVEIDYCPQCRGVWLDRGELDKLIERSVASAPGTPPQQQPVQPQPYQQPYQPVQPQGYAQQSARRPEHKDSDYNQQQGQYGKRKPKSWLSEIFD